MTALSLLFPQPNLEVTVEGAQGQEARPENGGTRVTAALSPTSSIALRWHRALPAEKALPRKIYVDGETLFTVSEGALRGRWTLRYTVLHQGLRELALRLPEGWNVLNVSTEGLEEWKVEGDRLLARLTYPKKGAIELVVGRKGGGLFGQLHERHGASLFSPLSPRSPAWLRDLHRKLFQGCEKCS